MPCPRKPIAPFRYFHSSPEVLRLVALMCVRFSLSLRNVEDLLSSGAGMPSAMRRRGCGGTGSVRCLRASRGGSG
jgi:hypothetical protein